MRKPARDSGFTLIEVMVAIALMGILSTIAVGSWRAWAASAGQKGAAGDLQTVLRQTQVRAVTEGGAFCITFDTSAKTYAIYRLSCDTAPSVPAPATAPAPMNTFQLDAGIGITGVAFTKPDGSVSHSQVEFRASGTAWPGQVVVTRTDSLKTYTLDVEGLTGRVSIS